MHDEVNGMFREGILENSVYMYPVVFPALLPHLHLLLT